MSGNFRVRSALVSLLMTALPVPAAQTVPVPKQQAESGQVMPERDKGKEDQVAKLFEAIRSGSKLPHLKRIKHRPELEQDICTSALTSGRPKHRFYTTSDPQSPAPELQTIASSNPLDRYHPGRPIHERYSVAVWRTSDPQTGSVRYWVGVGLYGSAVGEFVDCHFTDDVHYCGKWKDSIARSCRGK